MRSWLPFVLLATVALAPRSSVACELEKTLKVVGFDAKGTQVLVREESERSLDLITIDLASAKRTGDYAILEDNDDDAARPTLRARRWKQAEAELAMRGFQLLPTYAPAAGNQVSLSSGITLTLEDFRSDSEEEHREGNSLVATRAAKRVVLVTVSSPTANDANYLKSLYLTPDRRFVIAVGFGCTPKTWTFAASEIASRLDSTK